MKSLIKKQNIFEFIRNRFEFAIAVGMFMEFDYEIPLRCDFPEPKTPEEAKAINVQILNIKLPTTKEYEEYCKDIRNFDLTFECMKYAKVFRQSPQSIAEKLEPYLEGLPFMSHTKIVNGYLNVFLDRVQFFQFICLSK